MAMTETTLIMFSFWAIYYFSKYVDTEKSLYAILFGCFSIIAILTKGNALCLALVPLFVPVLSGKLYIYRRLIFWIPAAMVVIICGPWYLLTFRFAQNTWYQSTPSIEYFFTALKFYSMQVLKD